MARDLILSNTDTPFSGILTLCLSVSSAGNCQGPKLFDALMVFLDKQTCKISQHAKKLSRKNVSGPCRPLAKVCKSGRGLPIFHSGFGKTEGESHMICISACSIK